jgi:hypothetical protein
MKFCDEEIDWSDLLSDFSDIYDKYKQIDNMSPLQSIALARDIMNAIEEFKNQIEGISLKAIICEILNNFDIDSMINEITGDIDKIFDIFDNFEEAIQNLNSGDFQSLEDVENAISPLFGDMDSTKEKVEGEMRELLQKLFEPLVELGASQSQIDEAVENVQFSDNPSTIILDTFFQIADSTLDQL